MLTTKDTKNPGTLACCQVCAHHDAYMAGQGHPFPCVRYFWDGPKHKEPVVIADGTCLDFRAAAAEPIVGNPPCISTGLSPFRVEA